jgi:putative transposase
MPGPQPVRIEMDEETSEALSQLIRRHLTPQQVVVRARIIELAAEGKNHTQIARELGISVEMARLWRQRWCDLAAIPLAELSLSERLADAPRAGKPATLTAEQVCRIVALACEAPEQAGRPISHWTGREIADEIIRRGIVETISPRHAQRLLKRGPSNRTSFVTG